MVEVLSMTEAQALWLIRAIGAGRKAVYLHSRSGILRVRFEGATTDIAIGSYTYSLHSLLTAWSRESHKVLDADATSIILCLYPNSQVATLLGRKGFYAKLTSRSGSLLFVSDARPSPSAAVQHLYEIVLAHRTRL